MANGERIIELNDISPVELLGQRNAYLEIISRYFPKLKIVARGGQLIVFGEDEVIDVFEQKIARLVHHIQKYNTLNENVIERTLEQQSDEGDLGSKNDVIVFGVSGKPIRAQSVNQQKIVDAFDSRDMVFAIGPAGTGKTYTGVALAVRALKNKEVKKLVLTRPAVEAGESLGFLPGDLKDKLDPYLQPLYDALRDMIPSEKLAMLMEKGVIQIAPLAFMRGRTLDNAFVILDEGQNTTHLQMKMFLTRMGRNAKFMITGDPGQVDLPPKAKSGLKEAMEILKHVQDIEFVHLDEADVIRHPLVKSIIRAYDKYEE